MRIFAILSKYIKPPGKAFQKENDMNSHLYYYIICIQIMTTRIKQWLQESNNDSLLKNGRSLKNSNSSKNDSIANTHPLRTISN